jgi:hypothetical protein
MTIHPFRGSDFDVGQALAELDLSRPQLGLLKRMLDGLEIGIWFDETAEEPRIEITVVWTDVGDEEVATMNLLPAFEYGVNERNVIGDEEEIVALEKFRNVIDAAIAARRTQG